MRSSENAVKFFEIVVFHRMKNFLSLSDFLCVQVILLQFKVYLLSQKVILKHQICKHFRLMIA